MFKYKTINFLVHFLCCFYIDVKIQRFFQLIFTWRCLANDIFYFCAIGSILLTFPTLEVFLLKFELCVLSRNFELWPFQLIPPPPQGHTQNFILGLEEMLSCVNISKICMFRFSRLILSLIYM